MPHQLQRNWWHVLSIPFLLCYPGSASHSSSSGTRMETCAFLLQVEFRHSKWRQSKKYSQTTETEPRGSCTTVHKRQINQDTINQQLTTPSISHVDQFCLTQGHVNCQGAITRPTTNRTMTSGRTQCHRTSIKRNREHQSHGCLQSFLTHSTTNPGPPSREMPHPVTMF